MVQRSVADKLALLGQDDDGAPWTRIAAESGVALRTLSRWSAQHRADPTSHGLQGCGRADHHGRRIAAELIEAIEALALRRPEPTTAFIHRRVGDIATDRGLMPPSYSSVRAIIGAIVRITGGNFRLVDRLTTQIQPVQTVNRLPRLTLEIVDTAVRPCSSAIKHCENHAIYRCDSQPAKTCETHSPATMSRKW